VHALLRHLESAGFSGAPRVLGLDGSGREILGYLEGGNPTYSDDELAACARLIRGYHDAVASFVPPADARWQSLVGAPAAGEVVCHNDLSPANTVYGESGPRAFLDWDLAAPAPRLWDVAYSVYRFVPLYDDASCVRLGVPVRPRGPRIRLFCDAYGLGDRTQLVDTVVARLTSLVETARAWSTAGVPGWADVWRDTGGRQWLASRSFVEANRKEWSGS
jgi:aminoglycoside phosphotransferase (APT) family kinase protein